MTTLEQIIEILAEYGTILMQQRAAASQTECADHPCPVDNDASVSQSGATNGKADISANQLMEAD